MTDLAYKVYAKHTRDDQEHLAAAFHDQDDAIYFCEGMNSEQHDWFYYVKGYYL